MSATNEAGRSERRRRSAPRAGSFLPLGRIAGPMASLYSAVRPLLDSNEGTVLQVISAISGEGTSTIARELAFTASTVGQRRTLLIDGDRRDPATARAFQCPTDRGVIDCLWQQADYGEVLRPAGDLLSVGCIGAENGQAIDVASMRGLLAALRHRFALTVIDCPAVASGAYAELIPETADGIILVIDAERTRPAVVVHARELLQQAGGKLIGAVLNRRRNYIPGFLYRSL